MKENTCSQKDKGACHATGVLKLFEEIATPHADAAPTLLAEWHGLSIKASRARKA